MKGKKLGLLGIALFSLALSAPVYGASETQNDLPILTSTENLVDTTEESIDSTVSTESMESEGTTEAIDSTESTLEESTEPEEESPILPEEKPEEDNFGEDEMLTGWQLHQDKWYFFNNQYQKVTGWQKISNVWYYFDAKGQMTTGWLDDSTGNHQYYLNEKGYMVTGWQVIEGKWYNFDKSGRIKSGWLKEGKNQYYLDETTFEMAQGSKKVGNKVYFFNEKGGQLQTKAGWQKANNTWYYSDSKGVLKTGWLKLNKDWYYLDANGAMKTGWQHPGNVWYFFKPSGQMQTGWLKQGNVWYYLKAGGSMATNWAQVGKNWYHFDNSGKMQTGWFTDSKGKLYLLNSNGALAQGWGNDHGTWYYFDTKGDLAKGWAKVSGVWYYFNEEGQMQTGWKKLGDTWYYLNPKNGGMFENRWGDIDGKTYYFKQNGYMATGKVIIGNETHTFAVNGVWQGTRYQNPSGYLQVQDTQIKPSGEVGYNLSYGFEGIKTYLVQHRLGIYDGRAFYGNYTVSSVKMFQASKGLPATGITDFATWKALGLNPSLWTGIDSYISPLKVTTRDSRQAHIEAMIETAYSYLGNEYIIGASTMPQYGVDCSGLVMQALYSAGINPAPISSIRHAHPGYEYESRYLWADNRLKTVSYNDRQRGDLVFYYEPGTYSIWHVGIYLGDNMVIDSWPPKVQVAPLQNWQRNVIAGFKRPFQ